MSHLNWRVVNGCSFKTDLELVGLPRRGGEMERLLLCIWNNSALETGLSRYRQPLLFLNLSVLNSGVGLRVGEGRVEGLRMNSVICPWLNLHVHYLSAIVPLRLALPIPESVGSFQPLVVLHAHSTSFAERQRGSTPALCLLPWLRWHEPLLHQHKPRSQRSQPREAGALQGGPLCAGWELVLAFSAPPPPPILPSVPGNVWVSRMEKT